MGDIQEGLKVFDHLGFQKLFDAQPEQIQHDMLPAFGIPEKGTDIKMIRYAKVGVEFSLSFIF